MIIKKILKNKDKPKCKSKIVVGDIHISENDNHKYIIYEDKMGLRVEKIL